MYDWQQSFIASGATPDLSFLNCSLYSPVLVNPPSLFAPSYSMQILDDNPILYWPLNNTSGSTIVIDYSASKDNGTYLRTGWTLGQLTLTNNQDTSAMLGASGGNVQGSSTYSNHELSGTMWISTVQANTSLFGLTSMSTGGSYNALVLFTAKGQVIAGINNGTKNTLVSQ